MANGGKATSLSNKILDAFETITQSEMRAAAYDRTVVGTVVALDDAALGRYKVKYQDAQFYAYSSDLGVNYTNGSSVQVKIPNNDFSGKKMIIGTAEEGAITYGTVLEDPLSYYETLGSNAIGLGNQFNLSTYWNNSEETNTHKYSIEVYNAYTGINEIDFDEEKFANFIDKADSLIIGATFKTEIPIEEQFQGNYGLKFTIAYYDNKNAGINFRTCTLDISQMSGYPYGYTDWTQQRVPFIFDGTNYAYVYSIELFTEDFPTIDAAAASNVFIKELYCQLGIQFAENALNESKVEIAYIKGQHFTTDDLVTKVMRATVKIDGKEVSNTNSLLNKTLVDYYWFKEDITVVKTSSDGYCSKGGRGWRCLNEYTITEEADEENNIPEKRTYLANSSNIFEVKRTDVSMYENRYKCVAVYGNITVSREFELYVDDLKNQEVYIEANPTTIAFVNGEGKTNLTCVSNVQALAYQWVKIDNNGNYLLLDDTDTINQGIQTAIAHRDEIINGIANGSIPDSDNNREKIKLYQTQINNFENNYIRRDGNKIYNIFAKDINGMEIYKCAAYADTLKTQLLGVGSIGISNTYTSGEDNVNRNIAIINGQQIFKYNAAGVAPTSDYFEEPQVIEPLEFTFTTEDGIVINTNELDNITWKVPLDNTLIIPASSPSEINNVENLGLYHTENFIYTISDKYYSNHDKNTIELEILYKGKIYSTTTNFYFVKDGENGTNGTEYTARLVAKNSIGRLPVLKLGSSNNNLVELELWHNGVKIYNGTETSSVSIEGEALTVAYSMLKTSKRDFSNITISRNNNKLVLTAASTYKVGAVDILKAEVTYMNKKIVVYTPIILTNLNNTNYQVNLRNGTGYTQVIYDQAGLNPVYDSTTPFAITVQKQDSDGNWGEVNNLSTLSYRWDAAGLITLDPDIPVLNATMSATPAAAYDGEALNNTISCTVTLGTNKLADLYIPIYFGINQYSHPALNDWDGNGIDLAADGKSMLLSPQAGFGQKEKDNTYTGLYLGQIKNYDDEGNFTTQKIGLEARDHGVRTVFIDAEGGKATFGKAGSAQIILDPTNDEAIIKSGDFDLTAGTGMQINLTEPSIVYGSGKFTVNKEGIMTASNGVFAGSITAQEGHIAGWEITNTALQYKYTQGIINSYVGLKSTPIDESSYAIDVQYNNGPLSNSSRMFALQYNGNVLMRRAQIGNQSDATNRINISGNGNNASIYWGKSTLVTNTNGFYIGNDGISLGTTTSYDIGSGTEDQTHSRFEVTNDGTLYANNAFLKGRIRATSGYIGNGSNGWTIGNTYIHNNKPSLNDVTNSNGVYIGTNGISLGRYNTGTSASPNYVDAFRVTNAGELIARTGYIGNGSSGWTINTDSLTGATTTSSGATQQITIGVTSIKSTSKVNNTTTTNWAINRDGSASFRNVTITGGSLNINNNFKVSIAGVLTATGADISGKITASSGKIGNWNIENGSLWYGGSAASPTLYLGTTNINSITINGKAATNWRLKVGSNFGVLSDGTLYGTGAHLSSATVSGAITATSGSFTGKIYASEGTFAKGTFTECSIANSCTIGGVRVDGDFVKNANIAAGAVTSGKIQNAAIGTAKIQDGAVTNAKISNLSADKITTGTIDASKINVTNLNGGVISGGVITCDGFRTGNSSDTNLIAVPGQGTIIRKVQSLWAYNNSNTECMGLTDRFPILVSLTQTGWIYFAHGICYGFEY